MISRKFWVQYFPAFVKVYRWVMNLTIPAMNGAKANEVWHYFRISLKQNDLGMRASAMAFNIFMALFPAVIFFFTLVAYLPIRAQHNEILEFLRTLIPSGVFEAIETTLTDILTRQHGNWLSLGFFSALLFAGNAVYNMFTAFDHFDHQEESRSSIRRRLLALALTLVMSSLIILALAIGTIGPLLLDWLNQNHIITGDIEFYLLVTFKWLITAFLFYSVVTFLYYFGSSVKRRFRFFTPGATLATLCSLAASSAFSYYINRFNTYNKLYGSIGVLIAIMLILYVNSMLVLFGYDLDVSLQRARRDRASRKPSYL